MELPVEHGLLLDNLLDLAHAPFTHTSTFAKGWSVPRYIIYLPYHFRKLTDEYEL
jgi:chlorophyllide a oxygenase